jgi:hypothetical protein
MAQQRLLPPKQFHFILTKELLIAILLLSAVLHPSVSHHAKYMGRLYRNLETIISA